MVVRLWCRSDWIIFCHGQAGVRLGRDSVVTAWHATVAQLTRRSWPIVELFFKALRSFSARIDQSAPFPPLACFQCHCDAAKKAFLPTH